MSESMNQPSVISDLDDLFREMHDDAFNFIQNMHIWTSSLLALRPNVHQENWASELLRLDFQMGPRGAQLNPPEIHFLRHTYDGTHNGPPSKQQIDSIPTSVVGQEQLSSTCCICLEEYHLEEEIKHLPCKHSFHSLCLNTWLTNNGTCPYCRSRWDHGTLPQQTETTLSNSSSNH